MTRAINLIKPYFMHYINGELNINCYYTRCFYQDKAMVSRHKLHLLERLLTSVTSGSYETISFQKELPEAN